jgi:hypothetical protein
MTLADFCLSDQIFRILSDKSSYGKAELTLIPEEEMTEEFDDVAPFSFEQRASLGKQFRNNGS